MRLLVALLGLTTAAAGVAFTSQAQGQEANSTTSTPTTIPGARSRSAASNFEFAIDHYAQDYGVTKEIARLALNNQNRGVRQALKFRASMPAIIGGIGFIHDGAIISARLALTSDLGGPVRSFFPGTPVVVVPARWNEAAIFDHLQNATKEARQIYGSDLTAVAYDVFSDQLTIKLTPGRSKSYPAATPRVALPSLASEAPDLLQRVKVIEEALPQPVHGGQEVRTRRDDGVISNNINCTTGFGTWRNDVWSYITAGHCPSVGDPLGGGHTVWGYRIEGQNTNQISDAIVYGYLDSELVAGASPSWYTFDGSTDVDMDSTIGHIFIDTYYCKYGRMSGAACGTVDAVNQTTALGVYTTRAPMSNNVACIEGDSGGPVWLPGADPIPSGLLNATSAPYNCHFVALDDQLNYNGAVLL